MSLKKIPTLSVVILTIFLLSGCVCLKPGNSIIPKVIVDCDMSYMSDDALALSMLIGEHKKGNIELLGITLTGGNTLIEASYRTIYETNKGSWEYTTDLLKNLKADDIPVYKGTDLPLGASEGDMSKFTEYYNSVDSLAEWDNNWGAIHYFDTINSTEFTNSDDAAGFIVSQVKQYPGEVTVIAIGPALNIARAVQKDSTFAPNVKSIYYMCGAFGKGYSAKTASGKSVEAVEGANVSPYSEYNAVYDPKSLAICFAAGFPKQFISPGELTVSIDKTTADEFIYEDSASDIVKLWSDYYKSYLPDFPYWDPITVASFLKPENIKLISVFVSINTDMKSDRYGMTSSINKEEYHLLSEQEKQNWSEAFIITEVSDFWETALKSMQYQGDSQ